MQSERRRPKLRGKLHIWVGDADDYYLNNAVHLLDDFLAKADPPYEGRIVYGPGKGHGWTPQSSREIMSEMAAAMVIPAVPLIFLALLDVISGPICGVYCFTTIVAMVVVMLYRRGDYGVVASASRPSRLVGRAEELASFARSEGTTARSLTKRQSARAAPAIRGTPRPQARSARAAAGLRRGGNDRGSRQ